MLKINIKKEIYSKVVEIKNEKNEVKTIKIVLNDEECFKIQKLIQKGEDKFNEKDDELVEELIWKNDKNEFIKFSGEYNFNILTKTILADIIGFMGKSQALQMMNVAKKHQIKGQKQNKK